MLTKVSVTIFYSCAHSTFAENIQPSTLKTITLKTLKVNIFNFFSTKLVLFGISSSVNVDSLSIKFFFLLSYEIKAVTSVSLIVRYIDNKTLFNQENINRSDTHER